MGGRILKNTKDQISDFIKSDCKHCIVTGSNIEKKYIEILKYLNSLGKKLRILIRVNSMSNTEYFFNKPRKTGKSYRIGNLTIFFDSLQSRSQQNTPREFNCIIVYPINSLIGMTDNNIEDIINHRKSDKVFWISHLDNMDFRYLQEICDVEHNIKIDSNDEQTHERIKDKTDIISTETYSVIEVDGLDYGTIEDAISKEFKLGGVYTSNLGQEMTEGDFGSFIFGGHKKTRTFFIKAKRKDHKYVLLVKQVK